MKRNFRTSQSRPRSYVGRKLAGILVTIICLQSIFATAASAGIYTSNKYIYAVFSRTYENQASLTTVSGSTAKKASTYATMVRGNNAAAAWIGAQAILYKNGAVCNSTQMKFTSYATNQQAAETSLGTCGAGTYNSRGRTAAWNGNGYNYYDTYVSPSQSTSG